MTAQKKTDWAEAFFARLRESPNVTKAAKAAGITRQAAYMRRDREPEFAREWEQAVDEGTDEVEDHLRKIALGREKATGPQVTAAIFILKGRRKEIYGEGRVSVNVHTDNSPDAVAKAIKAATQAMDKSIPDASAGDGNGKA